LVLRSVQPDYIHSAWRYRLSDGIIQAYYWLGVVKAALSGIYSLAVLIPSLAVGVRRLHDTGKSGWWLLLALIPVVGVIVLLVFMCQDSNPGQNQYGPNPKLREANATF
jgi:uncharacterized membrane protein YhaH (DUF805 family)